jgi:hypothetical protein
MSPIAILLHIGGIISVVKDAEKSIADIIAKKSVGADVALLVDDLCALFTSGLLNIPGATASEITAALQSLKTLIPVAPASGAA